jgi:hypothetical protein
VDSSGPESLRLATERNPPVWSGSSAQHWRELAERATGFAATSKLPRVRTWVNKEEGRLLAMAERDAEREDEERAHRVWF